MEKFSAESADSSCLKKGCIVRIDNDKDFIVKCILVYSQNKLQGTPLNGPLAMDKAEILYA